MDNKYVILHLHLQFTSLITYNLVSVIGFSNVLLTFDRIIIVGWNSLVNIDLWVCDCALCVEGV